MLKIICFLILSITVSAGSFAQKFEAESATLTGGAVKVASSTESGGYYVSQNGGSLIFNLNIETEGFYHIYIQVASPSGFKTNNLIVDGVSFSFSTDQNSSYIRLKAGSFLKLAAGAHKVQITKNWGMINIDYIEFEKVDPSTRFTLNKNTCNSQPDRRSGQIISVFVG